MNGFLVLARCASDDIPLGLFATIEEANALGEQQTLETINAIALRVLSLDVTECFVVDVVEFADGVPVRVATIIDFEDDDIPF